MSEMKVAFITGAAKRIGLGLVEHLHQRNWNIILHYRNSKNAAEKTAHALNLRRQGSVSLLQMDFNKMPDYTSLLAKVTAQWGRLDLLINNASSFYPTVWESIDALQWSDLFASNAQAPFFLSQALWPLLKKNQGSIINIIDAGLVKPNPDYLVYRMAKASLVALTLDLAVLSAPEVRVNAIAPGSILWPEGLNKISAAKKAATLKSIPLHRQGTIDNIAQAVDYFISADYVTGQILKVDGGRGL